MNDKQIIQDLTHHPGWKALERLMESRYEGEASRLAKELLSKNHPQIPDLEWTRGYWCGVRDVIRTPLRVEARRTE